MSNTREAVIKTPFSRLLMIWRRRYLPIIVWGGAVVVAMALAREQHVYVNAIGLVESKTAFVSPIEPGMLKRLEVDILDTVTAGQVVAVMDDGAIQAELAFAEAELNRVRALLDAEMAQFDQSLRLEQAAVQSDMRRFQMDEEQARLEHLDRVIQHETDKVTLQRLRVQLTREEAMVEQHLLGDAALDETRLAYEALKTKVEKDERAIALAEQNIDSAAQRREGHVTASDVPLVADVLLRALEADVAAQQALVAEAQARQKSLTLVAPVDGQVLAITRRPGETVPSGDPILTIAGAGSNRVIAYVDERYAQRFSVGDQVELYSKSTPVTVTTGEVLKVGTNVDLYPLRLLTNPMMPQHGYAVLVGGIPGDVYRPGESLNLRLRSLAP